MVIGLAVALYSFAQEHFKSQSGDNKAKTGFSLRSPAVTDGGQLPIEFTGFGNSATLPLEWSGAPTGTKNYALIMHHIDPEGKIKWYWILYNIPSNILSLTKNVKSVGTPGNNSINGHAEYAPPHSKGPGQKTYIYTVYALSAPVKIELKPSEVSRNVLLSAMKNCILASAELKVVYARQNTGGVAADNHRSPPPDKDQRTEFKQDDNRQDDNRYGDHQNQTSYKKGETSHE